jgi:hypothetical protein
VPKNLKSNDFNGVNYPKINLNLNFKFLTKIFLRVSFDFYEIVKDRIRKGDRDGKHRSYHGVL